MDTSALPELNARRIRTLKKRIEILNKTVADGVITDKPELVALKWAVRLVEKHLEIGARNAERFKQEFGGTQTYPRAVENR